MSDGDLLAGLRVVELSADVPAAACGLEFARWGAAVQVFEPAGSRLRDAPPTLERSGETVSLLRASLLRRKTLASGDWRGALNDADVLVADAALADLDGIADQYPQLVVVHVTPFGTSGPYADFEADDLIVQAVSGFACTNGLPDRHPLAAPAAIAPRVVGVLGAVAALAALLEREASGRGEWIELSSMEACSTLIEALRSEFSGRAVPRNPGPVGWAEVIATQTDWITLAPWSKDTLQNLPIALGCDPPPDELLAGDGRIAERVASREYVLPIVQSLDAEQVWTGLSELGCVMALHRKPQQLLDDPQLAALDFWESRAVAGRTATGAGRAMRVSETVARPSEQPEHPLRSTDVSDADTSSGPLDGLRVLDLTHAWLGPYATTLLSDLGAEVIKIEGPDRPDIWRFNPADSLRVAAPDAHPLNVRGNFNMVNRGKRAVSIALDTESGRDLALRLIAWADVVLENFRPRVLENLRLTHEQMRQVNPQIALVSFSGYGSGGPYDNFRANGGTTEGNAGWDLLMGYRDGPPMVLGSMQADPMIGAQMAAATLAAIWRARQQQVAIHVQGSMFESAVAYIDEYMIAASLGQDPPPRNGNRMAGSVPHECFRCADAIDGSDEWIAISVRSDAEWLRLAEFAGLDRPEWRTLSGRRAHESGLEAAITAWTMAWNAQTLQHQLQTRGVAAAVVHTTLSHLRDPHLLARGWWRYLTHPDSGTRQYQGSAWQLRRRPTSCQRPAPRLGEHTREVLQQVLGLSEAAVEDLLDAGVVAGLARAT